MKVLALNSSARTGHESKTELMLNSLVEGMRQAGAEVEIINLREKTINYCMGCFTCWTKTPGVCVHQDDMTKEIFPKWREADLAVYASPLYHYTFNAAMKAFIERTLPIAEPFLVKTDGVTNHPIRFMPPRAVVVSVAGFPEDSVFDQLASYVNFLYNHGNLLAAQIYRPASEALTMPFAKKMAEQVLAATVQAGRELVESGKVSPQTMEQIKMPLMNVDETAAMFNAFWKTCIAEGVTPRVFGQKNMIPRPGTMEEFLAMMSLGFNPQAAGDAKACLQFDFSGQVEGSCHLSIADGAVKAQEGPAPQADLTIKAPFEVWADLMTGKADGQQLLMDGKYQASGDLSLLMRMNQFFGQ